MDYSFFDSLIDGIFIIDEGRSVRHCNEAAATLVGSSVKRIIKGQPKIYELFEVSEKSYFVSPDGTTGMDSPAPVQEMDFRSLKEDSSFKVQLSVQPFEDPSGAKMWVVMVHDVTLEERLHTKYQGELEQKEDMIVELEAARAKLEEYSKNLEKMVDERTQQVKKANRMLQAIMNSLGQGFLVFDSDGVCGDIYTEACKDILEVAPEGMAISEILKLEGAEKDQFEQWKAATFSQALPFDSMKELAPKLFSHSEERHITLDYFPIFSETEGEGEGALETVVMVATDKTSEHRANLALEREKEFVRMVTKLIKNKNQFSEFLSSSRESIFEIYRWIEAKGADLDADYLFRELHTLEGEAGAFHAWQIRESSREFQTALEPIRKEARKPTEEEIKTLLQASASLRASHYEFVKDNQDIFQLVSLNDERSVELSVKDLSAFAETLTMAGVSEGLVQEFREEFLYQDFPSLLGHFNDAVQQVADRQEKKVNPISFMNQEVRILPEAYTDFISSLVHVFRNSVDHGIEEPDVRRNAGKDEYGNIRVLSRFETVSGKRWLKVIISDDGGGIDVERIKEKIVSEKGAGFASTLSDEDVMMSIFEAGFTSRDEVGEFSGRGVGMDAVKSAVEALGGRVFVTSTFGKETVITIDIPDRSVQTASRLVA